MMSVNKEQLCLLHLEQYAPRKLSYVIYTMCSGMNRVKELKFMMPRMIVFVSAKKKKHTQEALESVIIHVHMSRHKES